MRRLFSAIALSLALAIGITPGLAFAADGGSDVSSASGGGLTVGSPLTLTAQVEPDYSYHGVRVAGGSVFYGVPQIITFEARTNWVTYNEPDGEWWNYGDFTLYKDDGETTEIIGTERIYFRSDSWKKGEFITWTVNVMEAGKYHVTLREHNLGSWGDLYTASFTVEKARKANPMTVKAKTVAVGASQVGAKAQSALAPEAFTVQNAQSAVTYKATANVTADAMKHVTVAKNGKVTVKKGTKAGTYKLKVKVTAAGNDEFKAKSKTVTLTVKVVKSVKSQVTAHKPTFDVYSVCNSALTEGYAKLDGLSALARLGGKLQIWRAASKGGAYELVATTTKTSYIDKAAKSLKGKTYWYKVRVVAKEGGKTFKSKFSSALSVEVMASPVAKPEGVTIQNTPIGVEIKWKRLGSYTDDSVEFFVGRSDSLEDTSYTVLDGDVAWRDDGLYFYDTTAESGKTYSYTVNASSKTMNWIMSTEKMKYTVP